MSKSSIEARSPFAAELVALAAQLQARPDISDVEVRLGRRAAKVALAHAVKMGLALPDGMTPPYEAHDGLLFSWQERGTRDPASSTPFVDGRMRLLPLQDGFFRAWAYPLGFPEAPTDPDNAWMWEIASVLRGVDVPELDQVTRIVGYEQRSTRGAKTKVATPRLWFFDTKGPKFPLDLDFAGYLRESLALVAIARWQSIFADVDALPAAERGSLWVIADHAEHALANVKRLFPGRVRPDHEERVARLRARV